MYVTYEILAHACTISIHTLYNRKQNDLCPYVTWINKIYRNCRDDGSHWHARLSLYHLNLMLPSEWVQSGKNIELNGSNLSELFKSKSVNPQCPKSGALHNFTEINCLVWMTWTCYGCNWFIPCEIHHGFFVVKRQHTSGNHEHIYYSI